MRAIFAGVCIFPDGKSPPAVSTSQRLIANQISTERTGAYAAFVRTALLFQQAQLFGVLAAQEQIQIRVSLRVPIRPTALPIGPSEITHAFAQHLDWALSVCVCAGIEDKLGAAL
jgi:hypothetical protein